MFSNQNNNDQKLLSSLSNEANFSLDSDGYIQSCNYHEGYIFAYRSRFLGTTIYILQQQGVEFKQINKIYSQEISQNRTGPCRELEQDYCYPLTATLVYFDGVTNEREAQQLLLGKLENDGDIYPVSSPKLLDLKTNKIFTPLDAQYYYIPERYRQGPDFDKNKQAVWFNSVKLKLVGVNDVGRDMYVYDLNESGLTHLDIRIDKSGDYRFSVIHFTFDFQFDGKEYSLLSPYHYFRYEKKDILIALYEKETKKFHFFQARINDVTRTINLIKKLNIEIQAGKYLLEFRLWPSPQRTSFLVCGDVQFMKSDENIDGYQLFHFNKSDKEWHKTKVSDDLQCQMKGLTFAIWLLDDKTFVLRDPLYFVDEKAPSYQMYVYQLKRGQLELIVKEALQNDHFNHYARITESGFRMKVQENWALNKKKKQADPFFYTFKAQELSYLPILKLEPQFEQSIRGVLEPGLLKDLTDVVLEYASISGYSFFYKSKIELSQQGDQKIDVKKGHSR